MQSARLFHIIVYLIIFFSQSKPADAAFVRKIATRPKSENITQIQWQTRYSLFTLRHFSHRHSFVRDRYSYSHVRYWLIALALDAAGIISILLAASNLWLLLIAGLFGLAGELVATRGLHQKPRALAIIALIIGAAESYILWLTLLLLFFSQH